MGLTKMVHPYCRLATMAMQTTPIPSCTQGFAPRPEEETPPDFARMRARGERSIEVSEDIGEPPISQTLRRRSSRWKGDDITEVEFFSSQGNAYRETS